MLISGLQKLTLLDYPGRVACTVFTGGCNFRCPFCHNAPLVLPERLARDSSEEAVLAFLSKRRGVLDGVAVTGGEPLLHRDIGAFLEKVKALGFSVKLDTNGSFPDRLRALVSAGLVDRVAMDVKNSPALYEKTAGAAVDMAAIARSRDFLLSGAVDYEFRTTVVKGLHTKESLMDAARWIRGAKEYYLQQFKDSGDVLAIEGLGAFSEKEMHALADAAAEFVPSVQVRGV
ncbi:MAG: anaerobic ribonucleoside-triphosphate reductase activating protein [Clostridia bacterium]|nr:anaerobic ribonucleoside-triphosphate reductase activating protein [Oscillospiraceae bacterium]MBS5433627.1 anaerobic ribonucleoside-triphosphate reductase activating protein [Bacillota bacterium]PWM15410.1 MAG: anaerobic ribonucleoside-triphosphate reductase activating protein [Clostridia bacterium]